jgi:signal transduction histidine kinase
MGTERSVRRIDWSQLWYPGPRRLFSAAELARGGADRPDPSFLLVLGINLGVVLWCAAALAPPAYAAHLVAALLAAAAAFGAAALWLWFSPSRRRLLLASAVIVGVMGLGVLGLRSAQGHQPGAQWVTDALVVAAMLGALGLWFVTAFRGHQIEARLRELDERDHAIAMARQLATAQIQPHFLFNSLAALQHWVDGGDARAPALLKSLTGYLRATLPLFDREQLTLGEELDAARRYLEVMQARLGGRLRWSVAADPHSRAQPLPPALLLTLVENAVEHGVVPCLHACELQILATVDRARSRLVVEVLDDGVGLPHGVEQAHEGLGLANSRARLRQLHGDAALLLLSPRPAGGASARIELPLSNPSPEHHPR